MSLVIIVGLLLTFLTGIPVARQISRDHPRGLFILFFTELWERFSFYGMRTLLILYLTQHFLFDDAFASHTFGAFTTLAYMLPLLGGVVADRYLGARRAVALGAVLLVAGHLVMAIEGAPAQQVLKVGSGTFEIKSVRTADARELAVMIDGKAYPMRQTGEGALAIAGLPDGALLPASIDKWQYELSVTKRDPLYVELLFAALSLIALGVGFLKGNVSTLVGNLYGVNDERRDAGFTLYYFGINLGSFWAAVLCGYLGLRYGWGWGFGLAAGGMLAGLVAFVLGKPLLLGNGEPPPLARLGARAFGPLKREHLIYVLCLLAVPLISLLMRRNELVGSVLAFASVGALGYVLYVMFTRHSADERRRMTLALALTGGSVVFWTLFLQGGTSLNLFADRNTDLAVLHAPVSIALFGHELFLGTSAMLQAAPPVDHARWWIDTELTSAQVQSFNVAFVLLFAPFFAALWSALRRRGLDPSPVTKFALGLMQVGLGFLVIVASQHLADSAFRLPLLVLALTYLLHTTGELFVSPVGLSELTRLSPPTLVSTMMAIWLLSSSAAQYVGSVIASFAATQTVAGQVLNPEEALQSSLTVFEWVGWFGVAAGVLFLGLRPLCRVTQASNTTPPR